MGRLLVAQRAGERGVTLAQLHMRVIGRKGKPVSMSTLRRYWYSTKDGLERGDPIELVDIQLLGTIAKALGVSVFDLLNEDELGNLALAQKAA